MLITFPAELSSLRRKRIVGRRGDGTIREVQVRKEGARFRQFPNQAFTKKTVAVCPPVCARLADGVKKRDNIVKLLSKGSSKQKQNDVDVSYGLTRRCTLCDKKGCARNKCKNLELSCAVKNHRSAALIVMSD